MNGARPQGLLAAALLVAAPLVSAVPGAAQQGAEEAYYRAVADHFDLPPMEIEVLSEWQLEPEEMPVALFVARRAGVSVDALVALRSGGRGWFELAQRYGLGAGVFHVPLPADAPTGPVAGAYERFRSTPPGEWGSITLSDAEVVALVNLAVLSEHLDRPPVRVMEARERTGSFVEAYGALLRSRG